MTRHEFYELFCCILYFIKNTHKFHRFTLVGESLTNESHAARVQEDLEASTKLPYITDYGLDILKRLYEQDVGLYKEIVLPPLKDVYDGYVYKVPDFEELRKLTTSFFCPLLFGALGPHCFYEVLCSILLEKSVMFVSENLSLLTSAVYVYIILKPNRLGCCSVIYPFKWQHVLIPILPNVLKELLDAPLPFIIGVNKPAEDKWHLLEGSSSTLIVLLDTGETVRNEQTALKQLPDLGNLEGRIEESYNKGFHKSTHTEVQYCPNETQLAATLEICKSVEQALKLKILNKLPEYHELKEDKFDIEEIKDKIKIRLSGKDMEFVEKFVDTQMFANYVEDHYNYFK